MELTWATDCDGTKAGADSRVLDAVVLAGIREVLATAEPVGLSGWNCEEGRAGAELAREVGSSASFFDHAASGLQLAMREPCDLHPTVERMTSSPSVLRVNFVTFMASMP